MCGVCPPPNDLPGDLPPGQLTILVCCECQISHLPKGQLLIESYDQVPDDLVGVLRMFLEEELGILHPILVLEMQTFWASQRMERSSSFSFSF